MYLEIKVVPTLTLNAYEAKDCVGALLTFPVSSANHIKSATIKRLTITDAAAQTEKLWLHLFNASPAAAAKTDADECVQVAADLAKKIVTLYAADTDYDVFAGDSIATVEYDTAIVFDGLNLYGVLEAEETPDYVAVDDLTVILVLEI